MTDRADEPASPGPTLLAAVAEALALVPGDGHQAIVAGLQALAKATRQRGAAMVLPDDSGPDDRAAMASWGRTDGPPHPVLIRRDGRLRGVVELYGPPLPAADGLALACALLVETARHRRLERRLVDNQRRLELLTQAAFEGILVHDGAKVTDANDALANLLGVRRDDLLGRSIWDFAAPEERDKIAAHIRQGYQGTYRTTVVKSDGEKIPVELQTRQLQQGDELHRVVAFRDIRQTLRAEQATRESEQRVRSLLELTYDGVTITRAADGLIIEANQGFADLFGYTVDECVGMVPSDLATPESAARSRANAVSGNSRPIEITGIRKDGHHFPVEILGQDSSHQGVPVRITGFRDLTAERYREAERQALETQLRHAQKLESLGVMAGGVAHDFNNLLAIVLGQAELAQLALESQGDPTMHLDAVVNAASRAASLTGQLLSYTGKGRYDATAVDINGILDDLSALLDVAVPKKVELVLEPAPRPAVVLGDSAGLQQVLLNLITNAAEAIGDSSGRVRVSTEHRTVPPGQLAAANGATPPPVGPCVAVTVHDDGEGMPAEVIHRVFDPFYTTRFTGRGLGLAAVLGIVRGHGGVIEVESTPGVGTRFRVVLPDGGPPVALEPAVARSAPTWRGAGLALLADDEAGVREVTRAMLARLGLSAVLARDGVEAVQLFAEAPAAYALAVVDITMPGLSGLEVLQRIRLSAPVMPVLLVSGYDQPDALSRVPADPNLSFLHKPFSIDRLQVALADLVDPVHS